MTWPTPQRPNKEEAIEPLVVAAGTALVSAMATDAGQHAGTAAAFRWRQVRPGGAGQVEGLDTDRDQHITGP